MKFAFESWEVRITRSRCALLMSGRCVWWNIELFDVVDLWVMWVGSGEPWQNTDDQPCTLPYAQPCQIVNLIPQPARKLDHRVITQ
jgi:hypothetical protein